MKIGPIDPSSNLYRSMEQPLDGPQMLNLPLEGGKAGDVDVKAALHQLPEVPGAVTNLVGIIGENPTAMDMLNLSMKVRGGDGVDVMFHLLKSLSQEG